MLLSIATLGASTTGCVSATSHPHRAEDMGYFVTQSGPDVWKIEFNAQRHAAWSDIDAALLKRAEEIAKAHAWKGYTVSSQQHSTPLQMTRERHLILLGSPYDNGHGKWEDVYLVPHSYRHGELQIQPKADSATPQ